MMFNCLLEAIGIAYPRISTIGVRRVWSRRARPRDGCFTIEFFGIPRKGQDAARHAR